jgi:hypothetical protein
MYNKLFSSILNSSIWSEDSDTCKVWITLLAMADKHGNVYASPLGVARIAALSVEIVNEALKKFMGPDPLSMDIARGGDGARIKPLDQGGWQLVNFGYYDAIGKAIERQVSNAEAAQRYRDKNKMTVIEHHQPSSPVTDRQPSEAEADSYSEADTKAESKRERGRGAFAPPTLAEVEAWVSEKGYHFDPGAFVAYYEEREWRRNDGKKLRDWHLACVTWEAREEKVSTPRRGMEHASRERLSLHNAEEDEKAIMRLAHPEAYDDKGRLKQ